MKQFIFLLTVLSSLMTSCSNRNRSNQNILIGKNLTSSFILLDAGSAYNLKTPKGAILKIVKNSFDVKANKKIKLEIKEAYSVRDILLAGLTTKSDGKLLQSGGMIFISATANDKAVKIIKPINVGIPSAEYDERMQLLKGEVEDDGGINWVNPQPLDTAPAAKSIINGAALFKANCASCHMPAMDFTGPALAKCRIRQPYANWAYRFTKNPSLMVEKDEYANAIYRKYNKTQMTAFPDLSKADVNAILDYCDNEAFLNPMPLSTFKTDSISNGLSSTPCFDSGFYPLPDTNIQILPIDTRPDSTGKISTETISNEVPMYQFNIDQLRWYNIDCFIDANQALVTNVNLTAVLKMPKGLNVEVYLCIPDRKLLTYGNEIKNKEYQFYSADGIIPLILNDEAIIFAFGADTARAFYGITRFKVQNKQHIVVNLKESTKEDILSAIKSNKLDGVKIEIDKPETYIREFGMADSSAVDTSKRKMQMQIFQIPCDRANNTNQMSQFYKK